MIMDNTDNQEITDNLEEEVGDTTQQDGEINLEDFSTETEEASNGIEASEKGKHSSNLEALYEIPVRITAVIGTATMPVSQLVKMGRGAVVELDKKLGDAVDIYANNRLIARGEVVVVDDNYIGVTMTEIISATPSIKG